MQKCTPFCRLIEVEHKESSVSNLSGVLKTRAAPNFSLRPTLHLNTPPNATSSPKTIALGSVSSAVRIAAFTAVN
eukprot:5286-Heterococcus_DN1.PRE.1